MRPKQLTLPSGDQFLQLVDAVEHAGAWCSRDCADFVRGLAFTGCRKGEANQITWRDVDFDAGEIIVRGDPETATKNWTVRRVPLIPDARALFERMRSERPSEPLDAKVFRVSECQKALDRACKKVGTDRITHHDLRHLFATRCIESGRGHSDCLPLARTQGRRRAGNENLRAFATRAQHRASAARELRASRDKAGRRDRIPCDGIDDIPMRSVRRCLC